MINISAFGSIAQFTASRTFPNGFTVTEFADDADPIDSPPFTAADTGVGLNGDMVVWNRANILEVVVNVIPNTEGERNLAVLLDANRTGKDKSGARDVVGLVVAMPDGSKITCTNGTPIDGVLINAVASVGRLKTKPYRFRFEKVIKAGTS